MRVLLKRQSYNAGKQPSWHSISKNGFLKDHSGNFMQNVLELEPMNAEREVRLPNALSLWSTTSNDFYYGAHKEQGITPHPGRMPEQLAAFFMEFVTEPGGLVLNPFAGSNTMGYVAEKMRRH